MDQISTDSLNCGGFRDPLACQKITEDLRESDEKFYKIFQMSPHGITITGLYDGVFKEINDAFLSMMGYTKTETVNRSSLDLKIWVDEKDRRELVATLQSNKIVRQHEYRLRKKNGDIIVCLISCQNIDLDQDPYIVSTIEDITERKLSEEKIRHMATHDILTDLPTLRLARDRLAMALNRSRRYKTETAVMFIDLDEFKAVNDTFGHEAGDIVLKHVAERLLASVRETDTVARAGGDEFLFIVPELHTPDEAARIAEKVIEALSQPILLSLGHPVQVGASIGIALYPEHATDMEGLIKRADEAMYRAKNSGKNRYYFATITQPGQ